MTGTLELDVRFEPRPSGCAVPLTGSQRRLWSYAAHNRRSGVGSVASAVRIGGRIDVGALENSVRAIADRHESLRSRIVCRSGELVQEIGAAGASSLELIDLSSVYAARIQAEARRIAEAFTESEVDPAAEPLFRGALLRLSDREHVLVLAAEHIISDAISMRIISREIWNVYRSGSVDSLSPLPVQFPDYAIWQQRLYANWRARHEHYWRSRLAGVPPAHLPQDHSAAALLDRTAASWTVPFGKTLSARMNDLAQQEDTRLPLVALAVHAYAMSQWCGQRDFCVAFASHGRHSHPHLKEMVGLLASFPMLRVELTGEDTFLDLLRRVRLEVDLAFAHYDFDRVTELLPECNDTDIGFNWITPDGSRDSLACGSDDHEQVRLQPFPLRLSWLGKLYVFYSHSASGIAVSITYRPDLFTASTVECFGNRLRSIAHAVVDCPHAKLCSVAADRGAR